MQPVDTSGKIVQVKERLPSGKVGVREYDVEEVAEMPLPVWYRKKDKLMNARRKHYYDRLLINPAAAWTEARPANLFVRGQGETGIIHNTLAEVGEKTRYHTNMASGGEFGNDETVIVHAVEVKLMLTGPIPVAANVTDGQIANATPRAEGAQEWSASLAYQMLAEQVQLEFYRGDQLVLDGMLGEFTSLVGPTASFGADANEGFIQNAIPVENNRMERPFVFENGKFRIMLRPLVPSMTFPFWLTPRVVLRARRIGTVYA